MFYVSYIESEISYEGLIINDDLTQAYELFKSKVPTSKLISLVTFPDPCLVINDYSEGVERSLYGISINNNSSFFLIAEDLSEVINYINKEYPEQKEVSISRLDHNLFF